MERIIKPKVHNRFDIEVTDAVTGEVKRRVTSYNIVLDQFFTRLIGRASKLGYIHLGTGTGTPAVTDTSMFTFLGARSASVVDTVKDYPTSYIRKKIVLSPADFVGANITEVGFGYSGSNGSLVTHSMLKDSEGNQIAIEKTDTDVLTVYATFYVTIGAAVEGVYVLPTANNNAIISGILQDSYSTLSEVLGMSNQIQTSDELSGTALSTKTNITPNGDYTNRRWQFATQRWNYDTANSHMISAIGCPTIAAWLLPNTDIFPHIQLSNVVVGLGDGEKTVFNCPLPLVVENSEAVRVDGVLQTRGEDYTFVHDNNAAEYPELFISADPKNCEVSGGYTHTSYYYYPFFVWGEYYKGKNCISSSSPIIFDYGHAIAVNRIVIPTNSFYFGGWGSPSTNAVISYSQDNETWTDILTAETALYSSVHADVTLDTPVTARYWRLSVSSATQLGGGSCPNIRLGYVTPGIVFTNPPAAGAAIEMDCKLDRPIKNENWVLDFSFAVQFERS